MIIRACYVFKKWVSVDAPATVKQVLDDEFYDSNKYLITSKSGGESQRSTFTVDFDDPSNLSHLECVIDLDTGEDIYRVSDDDSDDDDSDDDDSDDDDSDDKVLEISFWIERDFEGDFEILDIRESDWRIEGNFLFIGDKIYTGVHTDSDYQTPRSIRTVKRIGQPLTTVKIDSF